MSPGGAVLKITSSECIIESRVSVKDISTYTGCLSISVSGPADKDGWASSVSSVSSFNMHHACMHDQMERDGGTGTGHSSRGMESV